ncbi:catenin alpha-2 isoform X1 [Arapaima gigas]
MLKPKVRAFQKNRKGIPLVTTLVNTSSKGPSSKKKGRSKKAHVLAVSVEQATHNFLEKGEQIAKDSQDLKEELIAAVEDVRKQGETMRVASSEFADDPCSSVKRGTMVRAARALLSAVTRLLILADMADVMRLLTHLKVVEEALEAVKNATNEQDLASRFKEFGREMVKLNYVAARRQQELKDPQCRDEMAAARGALKKNATMLYTASQAFLRHPDVAATRANRDYVFKQVQEALSGVSGAAQAASPTDEKQGHTGIGELAAALNEFDAEGPDSIDTGARGAPLHQAADERRPPRCCQSACLRSAAKEGDAWGERGPKVILGGLLNPTAQQRDLQSLQPLFLGIALMLQRKGPEWMKQKKPITLELTASLRSRGPTNTTRRTKRPRAQFATLMALEAT